VVCQFFASGYLNEFVTKRSKKISPLLTKFFYSTKFIKHVKIKFNNQN